MTVQKSLLLSLSLAAACGGTPSSNPKGGGTTGMAVVHSDYKSTSVSLLDPATGVITRDDCIDSGTMAPVLSLALSGDVALPSQTQGGSLVLIDRTNAALVWVDPATCAVTRQLSVGTGFAANPQDVVPVSATKAYVSRYALNTKPGVQPNDLGDDLLVINPQAGTVTGRIDMGTYTTGAAVLARPSHALLANGKVYVALNEISADFMTVGTGRVAIVDPSTDTAAGTIDLPALKDCDGLDYIDATKTLLVSCRGDISSMTPAATSGVAIFDVSGATPVLKKTISASALGGRTIGSVIGAVTDTTAVVSIDGDFSGTPSDSLWTLNLSAGTGTKLADADGAFVLGGLAVDTASNRVYVTSGSLTMPRVLVYDASALASESPTDTSTKTGLPPRLIAWY